MYRLHPSWVAARELVATGRIGRLHGGAELVLVLQRRPDEHPQHPGGRRRGPLRHRLLLGEPVADAVRRGARHVSGVDHPRSGERRRRPDERDPRLRGRRRDVHLLDAGWSPTSGCTSTGPRAGSRSTSRSTSRPTGRRASRVIAGGEPPVAPGRGGARVPDGGSVRGRGGARSLRPSSTGRRCRRRPRTRSPTCGSSSACSPPRSRDDGGSAISARLRGRCHERKRRPMTEQAPASEPAAPGRPRRDRARRAAVGDRRRGASSGPAWAP